VTSHEEERVDEVLRDNDNEQRCVDMKVRVSDCVADRALV